MPDVMTLQRGGPIFGRLVVIGLGLIGGSFAKGLREKGVFAEVVGVDKDPESCRIAVETGWWIAARAIWMPPVAGLR